ncbi:Tigger transposable element-derived protein 1 [Holothuria leucospilota]|uniref:Tigger transposable element-derived protein 1 n=1 Tax=Holothuria leucospilota TaxID=206669 RepID=A0A9Q1CHC4_HOLLE|nr:Tigger transposable element-derived protein 1 [Holothuria leucospilota]
MPPARHGYKYCQWQEADMQMALTDVRKGIPIKAAARKYNVPRSTLGDRVREKVKPGAKRGAPTKFPSKYEEDLVDYITFKAKGASPLTVNQILTYAGSLDKLLNLNNFGDKGPSQHWWHGFKKRHPEVPIRRPDIPSRSRASNYTVKNLRKYFHLLKQTLEENDIINEPKRIWNCDESIVDLKKSAQRVVVPRRNKDSIMRQVADTHHISIHNCVSANGGVMPPFIIFSKEFPDGNFAKDGPYGALYGRSDSCLMDEHLFLKWFEQIFLKECPHDRETKPVLLLVDGHTSYCSPALISKAKEENVILFSHTIHISQPLDVAVNESLKDHIEEFINSGQASSGDLWTAKTDVPQVIKIPFEKAMSLYNIRQGFRKCGIYPFDPNAIDKKLLPKGVLADEDTDLSLLPPSSPCEVDANTQTDGSQNEVEAPTATTSHHVNNVVVEDPLVDFVIVSTEKEAIFNASHENITSGRQQPLRVQSEAQVMTSDDEAMADLHTEIKERKRKKAKKRKVDAKKKKRKERREQRKKQKH